MKTKQILGIIFIIGGAITTYNGYERLNSIGSQLSGVFGQKDLTPVAILAGGVVVCLIGIWIVFKKK